MAVLLASAPPSKSSSEPLNSLPIFYILSNPGFFFSTFSLSAKDSCSFSTSSTLSTRGNASGDCVNKYRKIGSNDGHLWQDLTVLKEHLCLDDRLAVVLYSFNKGLDDVEMLGSFELLLGEGGETGSGGRGIWQEAANSHFLFPDLTKIFFNSEIRFTSVQGMSNTGDNTGEGGGKAQSSLVRP